MRFSTFLLLFFLFFQCLPQAKAQNLIADWSAEEYVACPKSYTLEEYLPSWIQFRGHPDYMNTCSSFLSPLNNPFGWQHPKTGEGFIGVVTFSPGLPNAREYPGVELLEPLEIGESYDISFHVSTSYAVNPWTSGRATNNLGMLLMTKNYLTPVELGEILNFAHYNVDEVVADTTLWVKIEGTIVADSAYRYIAFGNFFDDASTIDSLLPDREFTALAYYYFDDFCVVPSGGDCHQVLSTARNSSNPNINVYPNPASDLVFVHSSLVISGIEVFSASGRRHAVLFEHEVNSESLVVNVRGLSSGVYILKIITEGEIVRKRIVIQN